MYFVNPHYRQEKLSQGQKQKRSVEIQSILSIGKYDRKNEDKRKVYQYFIEHPQFIEIERAKSLKARILCTSQIELISVDQYQRQQKKKTIQKDNKIYKQEKYSQNPNNQAEYIILERFQQTQKLAVLKTQTKEKILRQNESSIRNKMDRLRQYSLIKQFQYHQILYLAHFFQKVPNVAYKQFLFNQNQNADYIYFIQQGEFQVFKDLYLLKQKSLTKLNKIRSKSSFQNPLQLIDQSNYRKKQTKLKKEQISRLTGGFGQTFGQMELFMQSQTRFYSLKCNSSTSIVYKIHFKYFYEIFKDDPNLFNRIKNQYRVKFQNDQQKVQYNQKLKNNLSFSQKDSSFHQRQSSPQNNKVSSIIFQNQNQNQLKNPHVEGSFTLPNNLSTIFVNQSNAIKNLARSRKLYSENAKKSKSHRYGPGFSSQLGSFQSKKSKKIQNEKFQSQSPFFPVISKTLTQNKLNQNLRLPSILNKAKKNNKVKGLMDIGSIVSQKQQLLSAITNLQNPQFSFYKLDEKHAKKLNHKRAQLQKVSEQENSLAHSENFIKSLVKRSLKKSGYLVDNEKNSKNNVSYQKLSRMRTQSVVNTSSFSVLQNVNDFQVDNEPNKCYKMGQQIRGLLMSNGFDRFFYKI